VQHAYWKQALIDGLRKDQRAADAANAIAAE